MMEPYNTTLETSDAAAAALMARGAEIIKRCDAGEHPLMDAIWSNIGFHGFRVHTQEGT